MKHVDNFTHLSSFHNIVFKLGAILMLTGLLIRLFHVQASLYVFSIGVLLFSLMQLRMRYRGKDFTLKRLRSQQLFSCVCFLASAICMSMQFYQYGPCRRNEWVAVLLIGTVMQVYSFFRISYILEHPSVQKKY